MKEIKDHPWVGCYYDEVDYAGENIRFLFPSSAYTLGDEPGRITVHCDGHGKIRKVSEG